MRALALAALLVTAGFLAGCTSEDRGGLPSDVQRQGWTINVTYPNGTTLEYRSDSDPEREDTDDDGINDFQEFQRGTDARKIDTDGDGLLDGTNQCPDEGSDRAERFRNNDILERPDEPGCFLGETPIEVHDLREHLNPTDAFTSDSPQIGNGLSDGEEIRGWEVQVVGGDAYHVWSNPKVPDTDGEGLHDGLEKQLSTDPQAEDTDDDGFRDLEDAAPLGNLVVELELTTIDLKQGQGIGGGAELLFEPGIAEDTETIGPVSIDDGRNEVELVATFDVDDTATDFDRGAGAGNWESPTRMVFHHDGTGGEEPIEVRSGENGHILEMDYVAFEDTWTGDAQGGGSEGPEAAVTVDLRSTVEAP